MGQYVVLDEASKSDALTNGENELSNTGAIPGLEFAMSTASDEVSSDSLLVARNWRNQEEQ